MKSTIYLIAICIVFGLIGCGEDFLDTKNLYTKLDSEYYSNAQDISEALTGAYACLPADDGDQNATFISILLSDDNFGGGSINDQHFHAYDGFYSSGEDMYLELWETFYEGIFRTNMIISRFDQAEYEDEDAKGQDLGEALFLRAYFYFKLAQLFGTVPLVIDPAPVNLPKAAPKEIFAQIASDLKKACEIMPATKYRSSDNGRLGHATKWAAEALMARVYLFYTGYYKEADLPLTDGGTFTKANVIALIDDCIKNSGHSLVSDFRNLWPYSYATDTAGGYVYPFARNNNLNWVGEEGGNTETMFAVKYSPFGGWSGTEELSYSNQMVLYMAIRNHDELFPFGPGWGGGTVNPQLWESFEDGDIRREGSMVNVHHPSIEQEGNIKDLYEYGETECWHETGLWQKKYTPIQVYDGSKLQGMYGIMYNQSNYQLWNMQDEVLIRYADVLLMAAELKEDAAPLNEVRNRAGLSSVSYSLEALKAERRHEFAFEGLRYFDLLRWHDAESAFAKVKNIPVQNYYQDTTYTATYRAETGGFLPIPESQIRLSDNVVKQNPGWD